MSKHTPGPWFQTVTPAGKGKVVDRNGFSVANTTAGRYSQQIVDAKLIAAAPDLLDALESVLKTPRGTSGRIILEAEDEADIRAAIAKAKGDQQ